MATSGARVARTNAAAKAAAPVVVSSSYLDSIRAAVASDFVTTKPVATRAVAGGAGDAKATRLVRWSGGKGGRRVVVVSLSRGAAHVCTRTHLVQATMRAADVARHAATAARVAAGGEGEFVEEERRMASAEIARPILKAVR